MSSTPNPPPKPPPRPPPTLQQTIRNISDLNIKDTEDLKNRVSKLVQEYELKEREMLKRVSTSTSSTSIESGYQEDFYATLKEVNIHPTSLQEVDLLLIGKTGNGKSALGNSILGYNAFESKSSLSSVTTEVTYNVAEWNGYRIKVVDGPGIGDNRMDTHEAIQFILHAMSEAVASSPLGYHAFLLVVKFGGRFTAEDTLAVNALKKIFGENFFKKFCIIVMTGGDKFQEEVDTSFQEWVKEQNMEVFSELLKECGERIVLFNNKTQEIEKKKAQVNQLFEVVESLKKINCRYSDEHFNIALETRNVLLVESQKSNFEEEIMDEATLIQHKIKLILDSIPVRKSGPFLNDLYQRADALYNKIYVYDKNTGLLIELIRHVWSIMNTIRDQIQLSENLVKIQQEREEDVARRAEELRLQREDFNRLYLEGKANEESKLEMLQKQIDQINEMTKQWDVMENELKSNAKTEREKDKKKLKEEEKNLEKIRKQRLKEANKATSRSVFAKLKSKFNSKRESYHKEM